MQPKVSMVVPCYNKVQWIGAMFNSVLAQVWDNIELILVNDGSTDGTREVIAEYEPRFLERGYEVIIVDQENQGVAAAVKHGLERATGEYVCMPDCDDELDPEYVSAMAGWLQGHGDDQWVVCDSNTTCFDLESQPYLKHGVEPTVYEKYNLALLESFVLLRIAMSAWRLMVRMSYMSYCLMLEDFQVEPRVSQEPQVFIPLALGGSQPIWIKRALYYYHNREESIIRSAGQSLSNTKDFVLSYYNLIIKTLSGKMTDTDYISDLALIGKMAIEYKAACLFPEYDECSQTRLLTDIINSNNPCGVCIDPDASQSSGMFVLLRYFSNKAIGYTARNISIARKTGGRIIAYAAYGVAAKSVRNGLIHSDIRPDVFWDIAAKDRDSIEGIPIVKPAFDTLGSDDTVLLLIRSNVPAKAVSEQLLHTLARDNIYYYYDVADYLTEYHYTEKRGSAGDM